MSCKNFFQDRRQLWFVKAHCRNPLFKCRKAICKSKEPLTLFPGSFCSVALCVRNWNKIQSSLLPPGGEVFLAATFFRWRKPKYIIIIIIIIIVVVVVREIEWPLKKSLWSLLVSALFNCQWINGVCRLVALPSRTIVFCFVLFVFLFELNFLYPSVILLTRAAYVAKASRAIGTFFIKIWVAFSKTDPLISSSLIRSLTFPGKKQSFKTSPLVIWMQENFTEKWEFSSSSELKWLGFASSSFSSPSFWSITYCFVCLFAVGLFFFPLNVENFWLTRKNRVQWSIKKTRMFRRSLESKFFADGATSEENDRCILKLL